MKSITQCAQVCWETSVITSDLKWKLKPDAQRHEWQHKVDGWRAQNLCDRNNLPDVSIISNSCVYQLQRSGPEELSKNELCLLTWRNVAITLHVCHFFCKTVHRENRHRTVVGKSWVRQKSYICLPCRKRWQENCCTRWRWRRYLSAFLYVWIQLPYMHITTCSCLCQKDLWYNKRNFSLAQEHDELNAWPCQDKTALKKIQVKMEAEE